MKDDDLVVKIVLSCFVFFWGGGVFARNASQNTYLGDAPIFC